MEYHFSAVRKSSMRLNGALIALAGALVLLVGCYYYATNRYIEIRCASEMTLKEGQSGFLDVTIRNKDSMAMTSADNYFLSAKAYLLDSTGESFDLPRTAIAVGPNERQTVKLEIPAFTSSGRYELRVDVVKEHEFWLSSRGNRYVPVLVNVLSEGGL